MDSTAHADPATAPPISDSAPAGTSRTLFYFIAWILWAGTCFLMDRLAFTLRQVVEVLHWLSTRGN